MNIISDDAVFKDAKGIEAYMAQMYSQLPIEDFKYSMTEGFNTWNIINNENVYSGEGLCKEVNGLNNGNTGYWADAYVLVREANYFIETLPKYAANFNNNQQQLNQWIGEARFIRAFTYFSLAKRYGGIPIIDSAQYYPQTPLDELQVPRNSEIAVYDSIASDCDFAIENMADVSEKEGRANKYVAAGLKSRALLYAASIAEYNTAQLVDKSGVRIVGIPKAKADSLYKLSFDASKLLENHYSLYNSNPDKTKNYINLFMDESSPENIFVKYYHYPDVVHSYDALEIPWQERGADVYSSYLNPNLDWIELFDGIPKNANGTLKTKDADGHYVLYNDRMDLWKNAEPRLLANVIFPGEQYRGQVIDIRRGIYTGSVSGGITSLIPDGYTATYPTTNIVTATNNPNDVYTLPNGSKMNPAGLSGVFNGIGGATVSGFYIRKYLDSTKTNDEIRLHRSDQHWIEMRYAEILLNRAEAAYILHKDGKSDVDYLQDAFDCINQLRSRAGVVLLNSPNDIQIDTIRKERKKELAFENKLWWDIKRWRVADEVMNNKVFRMLNPFYVAQNGKYFFDARFDERNTRYTFNPTWYYEPIPSGEITKNPNLVQNPGY